MLPKGAKIELVGMPNDPNPLPFDELPINTSTDLLDRLEKLQPMSYERLDSAGISATNVRRFIHDGELRFPNHIWWLWKNAIENESGKLWAEIAPIIYHNY